MKTKISEGVANELNSHFGSTGVKYEVSIGSPSNDNTDVTTNEADHGESNMAVKDGKFVKTDNKPKVKKAELKKEAKAEKKTADKEHDGLTTDADKV